MTDIDRLERIVALKNERIQELEREVAWLKHELDQAREAARLVREFERQCG